MALPIKNLESNHKYATQSESRNESLVLSTKLNNTRNAWGYQIFNEKP